MWTTAPWHMITVFFASLIRMRAVRRPARTLQQDTMQPGITDKNLLPELSYSMGPSAKPRFYLSATILALAIGGASIQKLTLESPALKAGGVMPKRYSAQGKDYSPPLVWSNLPQGTQELALIFENVDEPRVHWLLYRIPATAQGLREGIPNDEVLSAPGKIAGTVQGITDFKDSGPGYHGPGQPFSEERRYRFVLYALNARLGLLPGLDKASLMTLIQDHIIGEGELVVTCCR